MDKQNLHTAENEQIGTLFIKDVDRLDCATFDPSVGVTGKSWYVDVQITGSLDNNGFVYDFSLLKKLVKNTLKETMDHALILPITSKAVEFEGGDNEKWSFAAKGPSADSKSKWTYECPKGSVYPIRASRITREIIEQECSRIVRHRLPGTVQSVKINLRKEQGDASSSFFRYTHGITDHDGLCQRLFHGHRSLVEVYVADEKRMDLERYVAHDLFSSIIHIASMDQLVEKSDYQAGMKYSEDSPVSLFYKGSLGTYRAQVPLNRLFLINGYTSIESISNEVALHLKEKFQIQAPLRVHCYEGIDKGAIAEL